MNLITAKKVRYHMPITSRGASHYINLEQQAFTFSETTIACLAGRIVSASKVLAEVQRTPVENGKMGRRRLEISRVFGACRENARAKTIPSGRQAKTTKSTKEVVTFTTSIYRINSINAAVFITFYYSNFIHCTNSDFLIG